MTKSYFVEYENSTRIDIPTTTTLLAIPEVEDAITGVIVWEGVTNNDLARAQYCANIGWPQPPRVTMRVVDRDGKVYFGTKPRSLSGLQASAVVAFSVSSTSESRDGSVTFYKRPSKARELGSLTAETGFLPA